MVGPLGAEFFARPAREVAPDLIGCVLEHDGVAGMIVEVERYEQWDAASHSFRGSRGRSGTMFGPAGRLYVYRSYGVHWCVNVVCDAEGIGSAVLLRAVEPTAGLEVMARRRALVALRDLCRGPGRLTQAFGITGALNGDELDLGTPPGGVRVLPRARMDIEVIRSPRIGITRDAARLWRYTLANSPWVSGKRVRSVAVRVPVAV